MTRVAIVVLFVTGVLFSAEDARAEIDKRDAEVSTALIAAVQANDLTPIETMLPVPVTRFKEDLFARPPKSAAELRELYVANIALLHDAAKKKGLLDGELSIKRFGKHISTGTWTDKKDWNQRFQFQPYMHRIDMTRGDVRLSVVYVLRYRRAQSTFSEIAENNISDEDWKFMDEWRRVIGQDFDRDIKGCAIISSMASVDLAGLVLQSLIPRGPGTWEMSKTDGARLIVHQSPGGKLSGEVVPSKPSP